MQGQQVEALINRISVMDRSSLIGFLRGLHVDFEIDFTDDFLGSVSIERLRHIVLAASLHSKEPVPN